MRTQRRLGSVAALVVIALTGSLFVAAPAQAGTTTTLTITKYSKKAALDDGKGPAGYHDDAVILAQLTDSQGPLVDRPVELHRMLSSTGVWESLGMRYTDAKGKVGFADPMKEKATYRVHFAGDDTLAASTSSERTVKIMRDLNAESLQKGNKLIFKGKVAPKWAKKKIVLERKTKKNGKWKTVQKARTDKKSKWSFRLGAPRKGAWFYRAWVPGKKGFVKSYSHITVKTYKTYFRAQRGF